MSNIAGDGSLRDAYRDGGLVEVTRRKKKDHASTGFSAAAMRALSARFLTFYFRAPVKAFFKPRIDYMVLPHPFLCVFGMLTISRDMRELSIRECKQAKHGRGG